MIIDNLSCIILAGGQSKRMGNDKAFLDFGGKSFIRTVAEKLSKKCSQLIISANKDWHIYRNELRGIDFDFVKDMDPYAGPLNAIASTSAFIKNDIVFIATCDTPFLDENIIDYYMSIIGKYDAVIPIVEKRHQPLNTLYKKTATILAKEIYQTRKSLMAWVEMLNYKPIDESDIANYILTYKSINTKEDYERFVLKKPKSDTGVY